MPFVANLKKSVSYPAMGQYLWAAVGAVTYTVLPTALKLQGWGAFAVGMGSVLALGILFDSPGLLYGAIGMGVMHLWYSQGRGVFTSVLGQAPWSFLPPVVAPVPTQPLPPGTGPIDPGSGPIVPANP